MSNYMSKTGYVRLNKKDYKNCINVQLPNKSVLRHETLIIYFNDRHY